MMTLSQALVPDMALTPQALNNSNVTGAYFHHKNFVRSLWMLLAGAAAATKLSTIQLYQAKDAAGTDAKVITAATASVTANEAVIEATVLPASVLAGTTITISIFDRLSGESRDDVYSAHATITTKANREFSISGDDAADAGTLLSCIQDANFGTPEVTASLNTATITIRSADPYRYVISLAQSSTTFTFATTKHIAGVEIVDADLDIDGGFEYVAANVATTANTIVAVALIRGYGRYGYCTE